MCDYCKMQGHVKDKCFSLHGYPDWHRLHGEPKPKIKSNLRKYNTNAATSTESVYFHKPTAANVSKEALSSMFTESQYQQLLNLLQQSQVKPNVVSNATRISTSAKPEAICAGNLL